MTSVTAIQRPDGRLVDIQRRADGEVAKLEASGATVVRLSRMPAGYGPFVYDPATKQAIPAPPTEAEALGRVELGPRVQAALVIRSAPSSTPEERAWAGQVLDAALERVRAARLSARGATS